MVAPGAYHVFKSLTQLQKRTDTHAELQTRRSAQIQHQLNFQRLIQRPQPLAAALIADPVQRPHKAQALEMAQPRCRQRLIHHAPADHVIIGEKRPRAPVQAQQRVKRARIAQNEL
jgi:hypothetical protein